MRYYSLNITTKVTNSFELPLVSGKSVALSGISNAAFTRVTFVNQDGAAVITFQGTGEDADIVTLDPMTGSQLL